jgi:hypothetical protein
MVHSWSVVLSRYLIHSRVLVLSHLSIHSLSMVLSDTLIRTEHPFYAHAQREQIHKVQGRAVGSGACTMLRADG